MRTYALWQREVLGSEGDPSSLMSRAVGVSGRRCVGGGCRSGSILPADRPAACWWHPIMVRSYSVRR